MTLSRCPSLGAHGARQAARGLFAGSSAVTSRFAQASAPKTPGGPFLCCFAPLRTQLVKAGSLKVKLSKKPEMPLVPCEQGEARAPNRPGGSGPPGGQRSQLVPPPLAWPL